MSDEMTKNAPLASDEDGKPDDLSAKNVQWLVHAFVQEMHTVYGTDAEDQTTLASIDFDRITQRMEHRLVKPGRKPRPSIDTLDIGSIHRALTIAGQRAANESVKLGLKPAGRKD